jgi:hypothetical protein
VEANGGRHALEKELIRAIRQLIHGVIDLSSNGLVLSGHVKPKDLQEVKHILHRNTEDILDKALSFVETI